MRTRSRPQPHVFPVSRGIPLLFAVLPLAVLLAACGDSFTVVGTVTLIRHSLTITANATNQGVATVVCAADERLVSGGFSQLGNLSQVDSETFWGSFPSDATGQPSTAPSAWTVQSTAFQGETVMAFVNCMRTAKSVQATAVVNEQVYTAEGPYTQVASCPAGTMRTGGGFRGDDAPTAAMVVGYGAWNGAMYPTGTQDWTVKGFAYIDLRSRPSVTVDVYAVCVATAAFAAAPPASTSFTILPQQVATTTACPTPPTYPSNCQSDLRVNGTVACPSGQLLTGGGYSDVVVSAASGVPAVDNTSADIYGDTAQGDEASWLVQFHVYTYLVPGQPGGQGTATLWAVCVTPS